MGVGSGEGIIARSSECSTSCSEKCVLSCARRLPALIDSAPDIRFMRFLEKMARPAKAALDAIAVEKPSQVKESSVAEARATPAMMGMRARYTGIG